MLDKLFSPASLGNSLGKLAGSFKRGRTGSRVLQGLWAGGNAFLRTAQRVAKVLWLEVTGLVFLFFSIAGAFACTHEYRAYVAGKIGPGRAILAGVFAFVFAYFGLSSFWNARKI